MMMMMMMMMMMTTTIMNNTDSDVDDCDETRTAAEPLQDGVQATSVYDILPPR